MKTKKPIDKGPRKGFSRIYLGENWVTMDGNSLDPKDNNRIRICTSKGVWWWSEATGGPWIKLKHGNYAIKDTPETWQDAIEEMKGHDISHRRHTIFLGYVRDTE